MAEHSQSSLDTSRAQRQTGHGGQPQELQAAPGPSSSVAARPPGRSARRPLPSGLLQPAELLQLQRCIGNRGVARMLRGGGLIQRRLERYKTKAPSKSMDSFVTFGELVDSKVGAAVGIIDSDPTLKHVKIDSGYIDAWQKTLREYMANPAQVPAFFFARYGYAVETIATHLLPSKHDDLDVLLQISYGHTRPDIVAQAPNGDEAWVDITSSASYGHITKKQGSGWSNRPYVAEVLYDMPKPDYLAKKDPNISEEQLKLLESASDEAASQAAFFEVGINEIATVLGAMLYNDIFGDTESESESEEDHKDSGMEVDKPVKKITKKRFREIVVDTCRGTIDKNMNPRVAAGILSLIDMLEVGPDFSSGESWRTWANWDVADRKAAKTVLVAYGKRLKGK